MIVMKFGGTSVEDANAIARLQRIASERVGQQPVLVISAMAGVTDSLLQAASLAAAGDERAVSQLLDQLEKRHQATARELLPTVGPVSVALKQLFVELRSLLRAVCAGRELTSSLSDHVAAFGERLSPVIVTAALQQAGIHAELVDARECIVTDDHFGCALPLEQETTNRVRTRLLPLLSEGKVPVLGGFIASNVNGLTTTLGRGGSDFTAALVGAALQAQRVEIWTDVDGIHTTDPRLYAGALPIETLSFHEAAELAHFGAKVLHPATLLPAIENDIPVHVLNSRNPRHQGTCVRAKSDGPTRVKAIAVKHGIIVVEATTPRSHRPRGLAREVFHLLEQHGCTPDIASISDTSVTVTLDRKELVPLVCHGLGPRVQVHAENSKALISLVAEDIRSIPGLTSQVFASLDGLDVRLISQGASRRSFSFVVEEKDAAEAVRRLHVSLMEACRVDSAISVSPRNYVANSPS
jgi:aspartate kinase